MALRKLLTFKTLAKLEAKRRGKEWEEFSGKVKKERKEKEEKENEEKEKKKTIEKSDKSDDKSKKNDSSDDKSHKSDDDSDSKKSSSSSSDSDDKKSSSKKKKDTAELKERTQIHLEKVVIIIEKMDNVFKLRNSMQTESLKWQLVEPPSAAHFFEELSPEEIQILLDIDMNAMRRELKPDYRGNKEWGKRAL